MTHPLFVDEFRFLFWRESVNDTRRTFLVDLAAPPTLAQVGSPALVLTRHVPEVVTAVSAVRTCWAERGYCSAAPAPCACARRGIHETTACRVSCRSRRHVADEHPTIHRLPVRLCCREECNVLKRRIPVQVEHERERVALKAMVHVGAWLVEDGVGRAEVSESPCGGRADLEGV